ncbi:TolC family protein [Mesonia aquimarina]|uniref:TolC family protein n=1 Tax=Mesonia aquimarina TaxID=1504967 RepID=UPI000EF59715|nr:TolC family protein [Mesonia aquimarina]
MKNNSSNLLPNGFKLQVSSFQFQNKTQTCLNGNLTLSLIIILIFGFKTNAQVLENYVEKAQTNNPQIEALELKHEIASEKVNEANTLPNTEVGAGYFVSEPETRTGAQKAKLSVKQMMPWFGTITARENYSTSLADAAYVDIAIAKRKLALSVTQTYYQLYALKAKQQILQENIDLLNTYEELALNAVEVNKASSVDVLRLQIRQNELVEKRDLLMGDELAMESRFNNLLNNEVENSILVEDSLNIPQEEPILAIEDLKVHPELEKYDKLYASVKEAEELNQTQNSPAIGFGLDYIAVEKRPDMNFTDNGKDIVMPMVSVSIPIFNEKNKSVSRQHEIQQQEIEAQKNEVKNNLETTLKEAIQQRISARISYQTQLKNIEQTKQAEEILLKQYETASLDFKDVLDIQELQLKFQLQLIEAIKNYYLQTAIINYISN